MFYLVLNKLRKVGGRERTLLIKSSTWQYKGLFMVQGCAKYFWNLKDYTIEIYSKLFIIFFSQEWRIYAWGTTTIADRNIAEGGYIFKPDNEIGSTNKRKKKDPNLSQNKFHSWLSLFHTSIQMWRHKLFVWFENDKPEVWSFRICTFIFLSNPFHENQFYSEWKFSSPQGVRSLI